MMYLYKLIIIKYLNETNYFIIEIITIISLYFSMKLLGNN